MPDHLRLAKTDAPPAARPADPPGFVETPTARDVLASVRLVHAAPGFDMTMIAGDAGWGKTATLEHFVETEAGAVHLPIVPGWEKPSDMIHMLWPLYQGPRNGGESLVSLRDRLVEFLGGQRLFLIFDEAQHAGRTGLDWLRMVGEEAQVGMVFAGSRELYGLVKTMPQFHSRLTRPIVFRRGQPDDVAAIARAHGFADAETISDLADVAEQPGGLRNVVKVMALARLYEGDGPATAKHISAAMAKMNLKPRRKK